MDEAHGQVQSAPHAAAVCAGSTVRCVGELDQFQFARFKLFKLLVCLKGCYVFAILDKFRPGVFDWIREYSWRMAKFRALVRDPRTENWIWMVKNHKKYDQWMGYPLD